MGFFSWDCKKCGHPMLSMHSSGPKSVWMEKVVVITQRGRTLKGFYDGYGSVGCEEIAGDKPMCFHDKCWVASGRPKKYIAPGSECSVDQGFFFEKGAHDIEPPKIGERYDD